MSWFNGQILKPAELAANAGLDFRTTYGFGMEVKLWIEIGEYYQSIPATVIGVSVGAQGSVQYKLALAIGDTGLYSTVEIPSGWITDPFTKVFNGPPNEVDAEDLKNYMGQGKPKLELAATRFGEASYLGAEVKGFHVKKEVFKLMADVNPTLADAVHKGFMMAVTNWITRNSSFDYGEIKITKMGEGELEILFRDKILKFSNINASLFDTVVIAGMYKDCVPFSSEMFSMTHQLDNITKYITDFFTWL